MKRGASNLADESLTASPAVFGAMPVLSDGFRLAVSVSVLHQIALEGILTIFFITAVVVVVVWIYKTVYF